MRRQLDVGSVLTRVFQTYGNEAALIPPLALSALAAPAT